MAQALYYLIIYPIELLLEVAFSVFYDFWSDLGYAIIGVSLVVNLLMLPLYNKADKISEAERHKQEEMKPWIQRIRKAFHGDERFMMLNTFYRKQDSHPLYALRSSLPLLLQIPFFIAAYHFLSHFSKLNGSVFGWIKDLGKPDSMVIIPTIGLNIYTENSLLQDITVMSSAGGASTYNALIPLHGITVNILPVLMTVINIISIMIYTKGSGLKEKLQLYVMAGLFLVLLYRSPSGLVVYWTMNNIFSLVKSIVLKIRKHGCLSETERSAGMRPADKKESRDMLIRFVFGAALLTVLCGAVIPSSVIVSSPSEFVSVTAYTDPLQYVASTLLIAAGLLLLWGSVFYYLASTKAKKVICAVLWGLCGVALVDFLIFGKTDAYVTPELKYDVELSIPSTKVLLNIVALAVILAGMLLILKFRRIWVRYVYVVLVLGLVLQSSINCIQIERKLSADLPGIMAGSEPYEGFTLSRKGKNVIVVMLDRAIGPYIPFIMAEKPELMEKFSGFVFYPNTVSDGGCTILGAPELFGGYEYTPAALDKRDNEKDVDKHNEALRVMPVIFSEHGFKTTVYDPPLANYSIYPDVSIYDDYPDIHAYSLYNKFTDFNVVRSVEKHRKRSFFMYGIYKTVPLVFQDYIYDGGNYHCPDVFEYPDLGFEDNIEILKNMNRLSIISDSDEDTFMMMRNDAPHWPCELQLPDYTLTTSVNNRNLEDNIREDAEGNILELDGYYHYHGLMATMIALGEWLDFLRENDVYDNTRIVFVADHGYDLGQFSDLILDDGTDMEFVTPLLMYKDFDQTGYTESYDFMTNADTPLLAMKGIIKDPVNPFTHNPMTDREKALHPQIVLASEDLDADKEKYSFYEPGQPWFTVHDDIYDRDNWAPLEFDGKIQWEAE